MASNNQSHNRAAQQDARAWAKFTGTKYTAALRQMTSPLAQGFLGERLSARQLITVLEQHPLVGAHGGPAVLGENGKQSTAPWRFNGTSDYIELALVVDLLRMFNHLSDSAQPEVSSYSLKHTAEWFLAPHVSYLSNGRLIWAAAALGIPMAEQEGGGPNLWVGVPEREHDYVRRTVGPGQTRPQAHHFRPAGFDPLRTALERYAAGEPVDRSWTRPADEPQDAPIHDWLLMQVDRDDPAGDFARDYEAGVRDSHHRIAETPSDLFAILHGVSHSAEAYDAAVGVVREWFAVSPASEPIRTAGLSGHADDHPGWGAGEGTVERYEYTCPCGDGTIVEEHDSIPGFRDHNVSIDCDRCRTEWRFAEGRSARAWGLVPVLTTP
ncbi:MAG: hypothetical protein WAS07_05670 [Micropruina sp.]